MLGLIDRPKFDKVVRKHDTNKYSKGIDTWTHFVSMMFMQLAHVSSLRDISNGIRSASGNLPNSGRQASIILESQKHPASLP